MDAKGKTAIVTGGASGLGLGTCRALAAAGARIVAFDVDEDRLESLRTSLGDTEVVTQRVDVSKEEDVRAGIEAAVAAFGSIDIAVNCAGVGDAAKTISKGGPFPLAVWEKVININLTGTFNVIRLAAVEMAKNTPNDDGERGLIRRGLAGANGTGGIQRQQGRRDGADTTDGAGSGAVRHTGCQHCSRIIRYADGCRADREGFASDNR